MKFLPQPRQVLFLIGQFEVYGVANGQITGASSLGAVGLDVRHPAQLLAAALVPEDPE